MDSKASSQRFQSVAEIFPEQPEDFLSPQQRLEALAEILAVIAVRAEKAKAE